MSTADNQVTDTDNAQPARKKALTAIALAVLLGGAAYGAYYALVANHYDQTDNAYVQANVVQIPPQVSGTVLANHADEPDGVKAWPADVPDSR